KHLANDVGVLRGALEAALNDWLSVAVAREDRQTARRKSERSIDERLVHAARCRDAPNYSPSDPRTFCWLAGGFRCGDSRSPTPRRSGPRAAVRVIVEMRCVC